MAIMVVCSLTMPVSRLLFYNRVVVKIQILCIEFHFPLFSQISAKAAYLQLRANQVPWLLDEVYQVRVKPGWSQSVGCGSNGKQPNVYRYGKPQSRLVKNFGAQFSRQMHISPSQGKVGRSLVGRLQEWVRRKWTQNMVHNCSSSLLPSVIFVTRQSS